MLKENSGTISELVVGKLTSTCELLEISHTDIAVSANLEVKAVESFFRLEDLTFSEITTILKAIREEIDSIDETNRTLSLIDQQIPIFQAKVKQVLAPIQEPEPVMAKVYKLDQRKPKEPLKPKFVLTLDLASDINQIIKGLGIQKKHIAAEAHVSEANVLNLLEGFPVDREIALGIIAAIETIFISRLGSSPREEKIVLASSIIELNKARIKIEEPELEEPKTPKVIPLPQINSYVIEPKPRSKPKTQRKKTREIRLNDIREKRATIQLPAELSSRIEEAMGELEIIQKHIAECIQMSRGSVSNILRGRKAGITSMLCFLNGLVMQLRWHLSSRTEEQKRMIETLVKDLHDFYQQAYQQLPPRLASYNGPVSKSSRNFISRECLDALSKSFFDNMHSESAQVALIHGPKGSGKTSAANFIADQCDETINTVARTRTDIGFFSNPEETAIPQFLRFFHEELAALHPMGQLLPEFPEEAGDVSEAWLDIFSEFLQQTGEEYPIVHTIEDFELLGDRKQNFYSFLERIHQSDRFPGLNILIVMHCDDRSQLPRADKKISPPIMHKIPPFTKSETAALCDQYPELRHIGDHVDVIHRRLSGSPQQTQCALQFLRDIRPDLPAALNYAEKMVA